MSHTVSFYIDVILYNSVVMMYKTCHDHVNSQFVMAAISKQLIYLQKQYVCTGVPRRYTKLYV